MLDTYARGLDGKILYRNPEGYLAPNGVPVRLPQADLRRPQKRKEDEGVDPIEAAKKVKELYKKSKGEVERLRKAQAAAEKIAKGVGGVATKLKPNPLLFLPEIGGYVFEPLPGSNGTPRSPDRPAFPPPIPTDPMPAPPGDQEPICGKTPNSFIWPSDKPDACIAQFTIYKADGNKWTILDRIGREKRNTTREELEPFRFGIVKVYCPDGFQSMFPRGEDSVFTRVKPSKSGSVGDNKYNGNSLASYWYLNYFYDYFVITGTEYKWTHHQILWGFNDNVPAWQGGYQGPVGSADSGSNYADNMWLRLDCIVEAPPTERKPVVDPSNYDRKKDEDEVGCQWQKNEISYTLPELKIGDATVGGDSINIDDGLIPLANFVCKSMEMMHKGLGLNLLDVELPKLVSKKDGDKFKPKSIAELTQWQFDNVSSLVGLPVETAITNLDNQTKDIVFRNVQDTISYMFQQQRESDLDLMVVEGYCTRIAQQLEAITQISLRQQADIEMIVKEMGFRWKWETNKRKSLYKIGMSDEDEKTGILELFKGGEVSYPVRVWDDKLDSRQIAMTTNLYAEIASKSNFHSFNSGQPIPGLDARSKMNKTGEEDWREWVKAVNAPEKGTVAGNPTPYIEEYSTASITAKKIAEPTSGLSLFMKPKKAKATGGK